MKLGLDTTIDLMGRLGNPQKGLRCVHVAGTNGKGSTSAILDSILRQAGYNTGLYTSPHLIDMRERIRTDGRPISRSDVVRMTETLLPHSEATGASFFEILTAMAFLHFRDCRIDIAILETGLGGRLDATNVVIPELALITEIGFDHTKILGNRLRTIAGEKAGILKSGVPSIIGATNPGVREYFRSIAQDRGFPVLFSREAVRISKISLSDAGGRFDLTTPAGEYKDLFVGLLGGHQIENSTLAVLAAEELIHQGWLIPERAIRRGLERVRWEGRLEILGIRPTLLVDSAHNPMGMRSLAEAIRVLFRYDRLILVFGVLCDKDFRGMLDAILPLVHRMIFTKPLSDRALDPERLAGLDLVQGKEPMVVPDIGRAWEAAKQDAGPKDLIVGAGSMYFIGEILRMHKTKPTKGGT